MSAERLRDLGKEDHAVERLIKARTVSPLKQASVVISLGEKSGRK